MRQFRVLAGAFGLLAAMAAVETRAQTHVGPVAITKITTGWASDAFALETGQQPIVNPAACTTPEGVISNTECVFTRPKIFGIYIPN